MRYTVIDLGSNTMRMSVYEQRETLRHIMSEKELIGLVGYTSEGILSEEGIMRVIETLREFKETSDAIGSDVFSCFATAGLRNIKNTHQALEQIKTETGIDIDVISGEEEARLDFIGAYADTRLESGLMADMGGASTELVRFCGKEILNSVSLPFGSLYLYKKFVDGVIPTRKEIKKISKFVGKQLEGIEWLPGCAESLCVIGGTARAAARINQELCGRRETALQGYRFDASDIEGMLDGILKSKHKGIRLVTRVSPERMHTIIPGLCAFSRIIGTAGCKTVTVSRNGVREGYLHENVIQQNTADGNS